MFTWILILGACAWVALLLLILHQVNRSNLSSHPIDIVRYS
jgi:hypothetical protein